MEILVQFLQIIKSKSSILKSLGKWDYDEIKISEPNQDQAIVKIISCGIFENKLPFLLRNP